MNIHLSMEKFYKKPLGSDIARIKASFADPASIVDMTVEQIADSLVSGMTIQPGVCPFSERSRAAGKKGTVREDFVEQTIFLVDIDNKLKEVSQETPEHVAAVLAAHGLKAAFMYDTFNSNNESERFRVALVASEKLTDREERDRIAEALVALFPQADPNCGNADRMFFGTDKGLISEYTAFDAVCDKEDLLALAGGVYQSKKEYGLTIPEGQRHTTLLREAVASLKRYGDSLQARNAFEIKVMQCEGVMPSEEIEKIWKDAVNYYKTTILPDPDYILPMEYSSREPKTLEPRDYTDVGQANVFVDVFGDKVRYTPSTGYLVYDGIVWNEDDVKAQGLSQKLTELQLDEADQRFMAAADDATRKNSEAYKKYILQRRGSDRINATLTEARPRIQIAVDQLDADGFLLNTPDGAVDLRSGELKPHKPEDYCTKVTAVSPSMTGADEFNEFMDRITTGDKDLERFLQEVVGMCAVGGVYQESLLIAYGEGGNGKSTFFNLIARVLGAYSGVLSPETLMANTRNNKSPEIADLRGKRIVIAAELDEGALFDTGTLKNLSSVDSIKAARKYRDPIEFKPTHTLILYTNHLPKISSSDDGTWARIIIVPFLAKLRGMKGEIKNYAEHLFNCSGGYVLTWIIQGAELYISNGCKVNLPDCVKQATSQYRESNNWIRDFLDECCEIGPSYSERSGKLQSSFNRYCDVVGIPRKAPCDFQKALAGVGFSKKKTNTGAVIYGLKLAESFSDPFAGQ